MAEHRAMLGHPTQCGAAAILFVKAGTCGSRPADGCRGSNANKSGGRTSIASE